MLILGMVIGSNNLAAALSLGALGQAHRRAQVTAVFGVFEFVIPLAGIAVGSATARALEVSTGWIGGVLLVALGIAAIASGLRERNRDDDVRIARMISTGRGLVLFAAGLSADNLVVGFGLGWGGASPLIVAGTIAAFSMAFTWTGMRLGGFGHRHWERRAKIGSGVLLAALGAASALRLI